MMGEGKLPQGGEEESTVLEIVTEKKNNKTKLKQREKKNPDQPTYQKPQWKNIKMS